MIGRGVDLAFRQIGKPWFSLTVPGVLCLEFGSLYDSARALVYVAPLFFFAAGVRFERDRLTAKRKEAAFVRRAAR